MSPRKKRQNAPPAAPVTRRATKPVQPMMRKHSGYLVAGEGKQRASGPSAAFLAMSATRSHRGWLAETTDDDVPTLVPGAYYVTHWWQSGCTVLRLLRVRTGIQQPDPNEGEPYEVPVLVMRQVYPVERRHATLRDPRELLRVIEDPAPPPLAADPLHPDRPADGYPVPF